MAILLTQVELKVTQCHETMKQFNSVYPVSVGVGRQNPTAPPTSSAVRGLPFAALGCCLKRSLRGDLLDLNTAEFMSAMNVFLLMVLDRGLFLDSSRAASHTVS